MTEILLSYFDKLPQQTEMKIGDKSELEKQWKFQLLPKDEMEKKVREEKQKRQDKAKQREYINGSTLRSNLILMSIDEEKRLTSKDFEQKLNGAKGKRIPILIKQKDKFQIYGDPNGDGNWTLTDVTQDQKVDLNKLPFEKGIIRRDDKEFTPLSLKQ